MIAQLNEKQIEEVLKSQIIGHLACHAMGKTYIVPISYAYEDNYVYAHSYDGMKLEMMRKNPRVCFQVDDRKDMANWKSVVTWGEFEELTEPDSRRNGLKVLNKRVLPLLSSVTTHLGANWPFTPEDLNEIKGIVFRILLHEKTGRFEEAKVSPYSSE